LQPASIEEVFLYPRLGRAIVLVKEDQLSLAIGRRGQNVRLASKLVGWDIEIMTHDELNEGIDRAEGWFSELPNSSAEMVEAFIEEGFLSYDDLTFLEPAQLAELAGVTEEQAAEIIDYAEGAAERVEEEARIAKAAADAAGPAEPVLAASSASQRAAAILGGEPGEEAPAAKPAKQTLESLFGPDEPAGQEEKLRAEDVFGEASAATEQSAPPSTSEGAE
jgi:transcription termination/antitermination protein NusA